MSTLPFPANETDPKPLQAAEPKPWRSFAAGLRGAAQGRAAYALLDQGVYSFGNMAVAALISRHGAAGQFGVYILTQRTLDVLIQLSNVFLWAPYTFHLPSLKEHAKASYQGSIVALQCLFVLLFMGLLRGASMLTAGVSHGLLHATFAPLVWASGAILFREFTRRMYFSQLRLEEAFWTEVATVVLQVAGVGWLVRTGDLDVPHVLSITSWAAGLVSLWWVGREWPAWKLSVTSVLTDFKRDLRLGRWFFGSNMVFLASSQCNPWVLGAVMGGPAVGSYAIAESLVNIPRVALTSMQNMMGPTLARAYTDEGRQGVKLAVSRWNKRLLLLSGGFALLIWCFGPQIAQCICHRTTVDTRRISFWLALNLVVYAGTLAQSYGLTAIGRADTTLYANIAGLAVQAVVCFELIRSFGVPGAAMALLVGSMGVLLVRQWAYTRELARTS